MNGKKWFRNCIALILIALAICGVMVAWLDPFFHYHAPLKGFYYVLDEERSQNDGITKHFSYDAVITGTSMTENFMPSEFDALFGTTSIKVPYSGATFKELNDNLAVAFRTHDNIRYVVRGLEPNMLLRAPDEYRSDMGTYPMYLYDSNPINDVKYLFNRDVVFRYCGVMLISKLMGKEAGVTPFDAYNYTGDNFDYGPGYALEGDLSFEEPKELISLTAEERQNAVENIERHVCDLARAHPETTFYYFIPPYSMAYWGKERQFGTLDRFLELHRLLIEAVTEVDNIHLYAFGTRTDITADLFNYHDRGHYGPWINSLILEAMQAGEGRITKDNAEAYLTEFETLVRTYDYSSLVTQDMIE